jgi:trigger factor
MLERALGIRRDDPTAPDPIHDDARDHLYERTVIEALQDQAEVDVLEIPARPEWVSFDEGSGAAYRVSVPVRPTVTLGDYLDYPFTPEVEPVTPDKVEQVVGQLRDQQASLVPVEDRPAQTGDFAVIGFTGTHEGSPVEGASAERLPLVIGNERMVPGFEAHLVGMREDEQKTFTVTFPDDHPQEELRGKAVEFQVTLRELRERRLPPLDDDLARSLGAYADLDALRAEIRTRLERNGLDRARHVFADRIIEYAAANATVSPSDLLIEREVDVMLDELKVRLAEQRIGFDEYLEAVEKDEAALREEYRAGAEHRVKVLLVLGDVAAREGVEVPDEAVDAEIARGRRSDASNRRLQEYLESERGRAYVRSVLRRSRTVEHLIDRWIEAHPAFAHVRHIEDQPGTATAALGIGEAHEEQPPLASVAAAEPGRGAGEDDAP